jgi:hypothetical protein
MPVVTFNRGVKRIIGTNGGPRRRRGTRSCCPPPPKKLNCFGKLLNGKLFCITVDKGLF